MLLMALSPAAAAEVAIDSWIEAEMALNGIPGLSLAIVDRQEEPHLRSYGVRDAESGHPMRIDTPIELASLSKAFTALALLHLEQDGLVDRNSTVGTYLPQLDRAPWTDIAVHDLLRHRSGLRRHHDFLVPCCESAQGPNLEGVVRKLAEADLVRSSQRAFSYANSNYVLLAALIQRMSRMPFSTYLQTRVFDRLGMRRTTIDEEQAHAWEASSPHEWQWGRVRPSPSRFLGWYGSSRVKASAEDMGLYMAALLDSSALPAGSAYSSGSWWDELATDYDLGWTVSRGTDWLDGDVVLEHTGSLWGADTATILAPSRGIGVTVLINLGTSRAGDMARAIVTSLRATPLPQPRSTDRTEIPDTWAMIFLIVSGGLAGVLIWYGSRLRREVRRGERTWTPTAARLVRGSFLAALVVTLVARIVQGSEPPLGALPTTIQTALPALAFSVSGLLLMAAVAGLLPKVRR